jgi:formate hydrogenlyase subunit 3/multisubunit Na+/H+ antiporter MnhD subunit
VVWILFPGVVAVVIFLLRRWYRSSSLAGVLVAGLLGLLAWIVPIEKAINLGPWSFQINESLSVLGRQFLLGEGDRPILMMVYFLAAFWFGAAFIARAGRMFVPLGLEIVALLTAALSVEPFLFAALFIEMAVLVSVPILLTPGKPIGRGIIRFLILQSLGMPFILFTEWMLTGVETSPGELGLVVRAAGLLGLGFMFLLAVVPFHTWVPMLAEDSHPYAVSYIFIMLSWMIFLLGLGFLDRYTWLRNDTRVFELIRLAGLLMVLTGGMGAAFQRHLGRILGFALLIEIGFALLAVGLPQSLPLVFVTLLPRALALGVWSLALAFLWRHGYALDFGSLRGLGRKMPILTAAIVIAQLSVAGFPLLAGFPVRFALWEQLAAQAGWQASLSLLGSIGLAASAMRTLSILVTGEDEHPWQVTENWQFLVLLGIGLAAIVLVGLFPEWFLPPLVSGLNAFSHLSP